MPNLPVLLGLHTPNALPTSVFGVNLDWMRPGGRLIWSSVMLLGAVAVVVVVARRPKSPLPPTWAMAILGALGTFAMMILAYGVVPHEWLTFANSYLNWGTDRFFLQRNSILPFDVPRSALKDAVAAGIYIVFLGANVSLFSLWQKREVRAPDESAPDESRAPTGTSAYGRPVTARG